MKDPKTHNIVFIIFYVYKKNQERIGENKDNMQNNKGKGMNGLDSPEKKKKGKRRRKNKKEEIKKRSGTNTQNENRIRYRNWSRILQKIGKAEHMTE